MELVSPFSASPSWKVLPDRIPPRGASFATNLPSQNKNKILVVCPNRNARLWVFDTDTQMCTRIDPNPTFGPMTAVACVENTVFVATVSNRENETLIESITLDQEGNPDHQQQWQSLPSTTTARNHCATVTVEGSIVIIGGRSIQSAGLQTVQKFNVSDRSWTPLPNILEGRCGCSAITVGSKVFVFGGAYRARVKNTAEFLDLHAESWQTLPEMPCHRAYAAAVEVGQFIFLIGGKDESWNTLDRVDCFDTVTHRWIENALPPLNTPRYNCAAASAKGEVFVFGGGNAITRHLRTVESIKIMLYYLFVPKLQNLFQQANLPLGLWSHIIAGRPSNVVFYVLLSERLQLDSILLHRSKEKKNEIFRKLG